MVNSTAHSSARKPTLRIRSKRKAALGLPPEFPLFPHKSGRWAKQVRGERHYFGKVADDPKGEAALRLWLDQKDDLLAGRTPRTTSDEITIRDLCNRFLTAKAQQRDAGELTQVSWNDYKRTTDRLVDHFGKSRPVIDLASEDFEQLKDSIAKTRGPVAIGNEIQRVRVVFNYGYEAGLIDKPVRYGPQFKRPSRKVIRITRAKQPPKVFTAAEVWQLLCNSTPQLAAMLYLGINAGFGNSDCASLPTWALDLEGGWVTFPRVKTGLQRRVPLWPETTKAIMASLAKRRVPKDAAHNNLVFITAARGSFAKSTTDSPIAKEFAKLVKLLGIDQTGRGFYSLRHTFRTAAGASRDLEAIRSIMGHVNEHVEDTYIHGIADERLRHVTNTVRKWLLAGKPAKRRKLVIRRKGKEPRICK